MNNIEIQAAYEDGKRVKATGEPYQVWADDSPVTLAFWDGYYGRPLRERTRGGFSDLSNNLSRENPPLVITNA